MQQSYINTEVKEFMLLKDVIAYSEKEKVLGTVVEYSRVKKTATLKNGEKLHVVDAEDIFTMDYIGEMNNTPIYEYDVFKGVGSDVRYIIKLNKEGLAELHVIDKKLKELRIADVTPVKELSKFSHSLELQENYFILKEKLPVVDFNIRVVREYSNGKTSYFYVGNNPKDETVDVIRVIFMGSTVLEEEKYERTTISWDDYLKRVELKAWEEVRPQEIANYLYGMASENEVQPQEQAKGQAKYIASQIKTGLKKKTNECSLCEEEFSNCTCNPFD